MCRAGAALADERAAKEAPAAAEPSGLGKRTQVEALASYAARARFDDFSAASRKQLHIHILGSLGCCIAALGAGPIQACREQVSEFGGAGPCTLIGGGKVNPVYAAFWNTALVRYVDFMDNFLAQSETCHTADNFGVALAIADYVGGSGRDLMLAVALGYTVQSRFVDHAHFMTRGCNSTSEKVPPKVNVITTVYGVKTRKCTNCPARVNELATQAASIESRRRSGRNEPAAG